MTKFWLDLEKKIIKTAQNHSVSRYRLFTPYLNSDFPNLTTDYPKL